MRGQTGDRQRDHEICSPALLAGWDALMGARGGAFVLVRRDFDLWRNVWREVVVYTPTAIVLQIGIGFRTHLRRS